jgi:hypothetical protein
MGKKRSMKKETDEKKEESKQRVGKSVRREGRLNREVKHGRE